MSDIFMMFPRFPTRKTSRTMPLKLHCEKSNSLVVLPRLAKPQIDIGQDLLAHFLSLLSDDSLSGYPTNF
ncbi:hypothetical protein ACC817_11875 [Rhizobium ruizarguesonis]|uniref:hypothetical protein n=1 Tax=Rhizobium ruizarguesonis TaxID=2081791 RepID=UPI00102F5189|nr:hypothetical protein [Rhizobium ruizarguesonis]TAY76912.1 hypothetical protein ELH84_25125 [Rhizobium ruizarguesonis]